MSCWLKANYSIFTLFYCTCCCQYPFLPTLSLSPPHNNILLIHIYGHTSSKGRNLCTFTICSVLCRPAVTHCQQQLNCYSIRTGYLLLLSVVLLHSLSTIVLPYCSFATQSTLVIVWNSCLPLPDWLTILRFVNWLCGSYGCAGNYFCSLCYRLKLFLCLEGWLWSSHFTFPLGLCMYSISVNNTSWMIHKITHC